MLMFTRHNALVALLWVSSLAVVFCQDCYSADMQGSLSYKDDMSYRKDALRSECYESMRFVSDGCDVTLTSTKDDCDWLSLTGKMYASTGATLSGRAEKSSSSSTSFVLVVNNKYDYVTLMLRKQQNIKVVFKVKSGKVLALTADINSGDVEWGLGSDDTTSGMSQANCNPGGLYLKLMGSGNCKGRASGWCVKAGLMAWTGSDCRLVIWSRAQYGCPMFTGWIESNGASAGLRVGAYMQSAINDLNYTGPGGPADSGVAGPGRRLNAAYKGHGSHRTHGQSTPQSYKPARRLAGSEEAVESGLEAENGRELLQGNAWPPGEQWTISSNDGALPLVLRSSNSCTMMLTRDQDYNWPLWGSILDIQ